MIDSFIFYNYNGVVLEMNDDKIPFTKFVMDVDIRNDERTRSQEHGIWPSATFFGARKFSIEGDLLGSDYGPLVDLRELVMEAVLPDPDTGYDASGILEILFTDRPEPYVVEAVVASYPEIAIEAVTGSWNNFQLNFKTFDPWMLGKNMNTKTATTTMTVFGRTYNKTYNRTYAPDTFVGNVVSVNNAGNYPTYPKITLNGPGKGPEVWFGARRLRLPTLNLDSGQSVILDFRKRTAVTTGGVNVFDDVDDNADWFRLPRGVSTISVHWSLWGPGTSADIKWQNAYMV